MPRVETDRLAVEDLDRIYDYIGIEHSNREAADRFIHEIHAKFLQYARQPEMGEPRFDLGEGLRSFPFKKNYVVIVNVHRSGSGSFFGGDLRVLYCTSSPKNVPDPLILHRKRVCPVNGYS